jgi:superfamily II DNA helicase RecQ
MFPEAILLALSATCTKGIEKRVLHVLGVDKKSMTFIRLSPNKENIKFVVKKVPNSIEVSMFWLMEALNNLEVKFPRTIIYCNTIKDVSTMYNFLTSEIPESDSFVEMFHSETPSDQKASIIENLGKDSSLRVVLATSALGMGVDVKFCNTVVVYGPPMNVADLIQETGRVGRDGSPSVAVILYNSYHLKNLDVEVKTFLRTDVCRRQTLMENFHSSAEMVAVNKSKNAHHCCDICMKFCTCGHCVNLPIEKLMKDVTLENRTDVEATDSDSDTISYFYESDLSDHDD